MRNARITSLMLATIAAVAVAMPATAQERDRRVTQPADTSTQTAQTTPRQEAQTKRMTPGQKQKISGSFLAGKRIKWSFKT
jgi:hypothetical protein